MFSKTSCVGRLCPKSLEKINVEGFVKRVVLVPYIRRSEIYVGVLTDNETFLWSDCEKGEKPFVCAEETLNISKIPSREVTHIFLGGQTKPVVMLIFIKLDDNSGFKCLNFIKVSPKMKLEYAEDIAYTLSFKKSKIHIKDIEYNWPHILRVAAEKNDRDTINYILETIEEPVQSFSWSRGVYGAAKGGHVDLMKFLITKGLYFDPDLAMNYAAEAGKKNVIDFLIKFGVSKGGLNGGMLAATRTGRNDLVKFFISRGADDFERGLQYARDLGEKSLIDIFKKK